MLFLATASNLWKKVVLAGADALDVWQCIVYE